MNFAEFTLVPKDYRKKDPRSLLYYYPTSINVVAYAKKIQKFSFYQTLEVAEELAKKQGFILLPYACIHWQRAKNYGLDRKIKIGRNSFFLMKPHELTKTEELKLERYLEELHQEEYIS
ncbi:hypothetical protein J27TS8_27570 [Robertmurraya siralis]|uniref:Uncharacterized protein n=1 Tax=Robertmurraya siralis TaxID=77777 RepID=A0A920BUA2_9BACI|nr:hypothetical protein [Robertmurraya siralis]GIN62764.1 hypothetical protein J27TS8_27570 [Robertmurraya siralis]